MRRALLFAVVLAACRGKQESIAKLTESPVDAATDVADADAEAGRRPDARLVLDPHKVTAFGVRRVAIDMALEKAGIQVVAPKTPHPDEIFLLLPPGLPLEKVSALDVERFRDAPVQLRDVATLEVMMGGY